MVSHSVPASPLKSIPSPHKSQLPRDAQDLEMARWLQMLATEDQSIFDAPVNFDDDHLSHGIDVLINELLEPQIPRPFPTKRSIDVTVYEELMELQENKLQIEDLLNSVEVKLKQISSKKRRT